jgi:hypothetical protein
MPHSHKYLWDAAPNIRDQSLLSVRSKDFTQSSQIGNGTVRGNWPAIRLPCSYFRQSGCQFRLALIGKIERRRRNALILNV